MRYTLSILFIFTLIVGNTQPTMTISDSRIGILKTESNKMLGYGFVAMNKNVVFTAAHNIIFDEHIIFEDSQGRNHAMRVVATDKVGDIGVLMTGNTIHDDPFKLNLNYAVDQETELFGFGMDDSSHSQTKMRAQLTGKSSKIEKKKEFRSIDLVLTSASELDGMPIINVNGEVIGLVTESQSGTDGRSKCSVSVMDGDMWKKM